ncbi:MAG: hypothetical protein SGCHY_000289 [Lobulomycetales sp.]
MSATHFPVSHNGTADPSTPSGSPSKQSRISEKVAMEESNFGIKQFVKARQDFEDASRQIRVLEAQVEELSNENVQLKQKVVVTVKKKENVRSDWEREITLYNKQRDSWLHHEKNLKETILQLRLQMRSVSKREKENECDTNSTRWSADPRESPIAATEEEPLRKHIAELQQKNENLSTETERLAILLEQSEKEKGSLRNDLEEMQTIHRNLMDDNERYQSLLEETNHEFLDSKFMHNVNRGLLGGFRSQETLTFLFEAQSKNNTSDSSRELVEELEELVLQNQMYQAQITSLKLYIEKILRKISKDKRFEEELFDTLE